MVQEIEKEVLGHLNWLVSRFKLLSVKLIGFVVTCWLVIAALWTGLVLPVSLMRTQMAHGSEAKVITAKEVLRRQADDYRVNRAPTQIRYQAPAVVRNNALKPAVKNEIRNASNALYELRRLGNGVQSLTRQ